MDRREAEAEPAGDALAAAALLLLISATASSRERAASRFCFCTDAASRLVEAVESAALEALAGIPVARPLPGSAELPRAARPDLRRRRSRAGALSRLHIDHA